MQRARKEQQPVPQVSDEHSLALCHWGNLFPANLYIASKLKCADDHSRFVELRRPAFQCPDGFLACGMVLRMSLTLFDAVRAADKLNWPLSGWCRRWLLFGPPRQEHRKRKSAAPRAPKRFLQSFECWLAAKVGLSLHKLSDSGMLLGLALQRYGKHLFYLGSPRCKFTETINAVVAAFSWLRQFLSAAGKLHSLVGGSRAKRKRPGLPRSTAAAPFCRGLAFGFSHTSVTL